jgi:hypothetical protein
MNAIRKKLVKAKTPAAEDIIAPPPVKTDTSARALLTPVEPTLPVEFDGFAMIGEEFGQRARLKFMKGEWADGDEVRHDKERMVAHMPRLFQGWHKWQDRRPIVVEGGFVAEGYRPQTRAELGDLDSNQWEIDERGKRRDPWQFGFQLLLEDEHGKVFIWSAASQGALQAVGDLSLDYARYKRQGGRGNPIVELGCDYYTHKEFGKIYKPKLPILGWTGENLLGDDEIPE